MEQANLTNWMHPPHSRWAFRNIDQVLRTEPVAAGDRPLALTTDTVDLLDLLFSWTTEDEIPVRDALDRLSVDSFIALHGNTVRFEWYAPHTNARDLHILFSVSKSVTALLAGALAGAGKLDPEAEVTEYVPEVAGSGFGGARVRHLLDMTASLDFIEDYGPDGEFTVFSQAGGWGPGPATVDLRTFLAGVRPGGAHGERFDYLSPSTDLLGWVCERAAGAPFPEALSRWLWRPMGAGADATVTVDEFGLARAAGGISATLRDMARIGRLVLDRGRDIVPDWFVDEMLTGLTAHVWSIGSYADFFANGAYRNCWYQPHVAGRILCAIGIHGQFIQVDFDRDVVVAMASSYPEADEPDAEHTALALATTVGEAIGH